MRRWHISMTFEGYAEAETSTGASDAFKAMLGLAPASRRSEVHMTGMSAREVDAAGLQVGPGSGVVGTDVESHVVRIPGEPDGT